MLALAVADRRLTDFPLHSCLTIKHRKASDGKSPAEIAKDKKADRGGMTSASEGEETKKRK